MGSQIAAHFANAGLEVALLDIAPGEGAPNSTVEKLFRQATKMRPEPFFDDDAVQRVRLGNFEQHFDWIGEADWVVEAVVERMDIKRQVLERVEKSARPDAVISTNTSGLPIGEISEGRSAAFRSRFLGTHFFNPPRYLKLLELIPTADTDPDVLERVAAFGRIHLGKGIVVAKDRPYFIGNRIGIYGMMAAIRQFTDGDYSIEEVDYLTGSLAGRPKSATFRTADVVGLDVMKHVIENLASSVPEDESVDRFSVPAVLERLVEAGALGAKTGAGFYRKEGQVIKSIDPSSGDYVAPLERDLGDLSGIRSQPQLADRMRALFQDDGRAGVFFRNTTLDMLAYAARRIPEVTDNPADVDRAIRWGFGWEAGPFEIWDMLGVDRVVEAMDAGGFTCPGWVRDMSAAGRQSFYETRKGKRTVFIPSEGHAEVDEAPVDEISLATIRSGDAATVWSSDEAALLDLGDGVVLYEFRSKANSLGREVMQGLNHCIDLIEADRDIRGMVIGNEGSNFSVGANLGEAAMAVAMGDFDAIEESVDLFQQTIQRVRYAEKPVVVTTHQRVLGGACEMTMACPNPVLSAETYIGLVELGVGIIPAGTGCMQLAARAASLAPNGRDSEIQAVMRKMFGDVAMAKVATSATQAIAMGFSPATARIVMNAERRFHVARSVVVSLSDQGYLPPPVRTHIRVLGRAGYAAMKAGAYQFLQGRFISEYDFRLASELAYVLAGGDLTGSQEVHEDYLLDLEREAFMRLIGEEKTRERIAHILETNTPLRN